MNEIEPTADPPASARRVLAAVVVLAVALVAGSTALLAGRSAPNNGAALPALPALAAMPGLPGMAPAAGTASLAQPIGGPPTYQLKGPLPALAGQAPAYRLDKGITEAAVTRLAVALGLHATVKPEPSGWSVTERDRRLDVFKDMGGVWHYSAVNGGCGVMAPMKGQGAAVPLPGCPTLHGCVGISAMTGAPGGVVCSGATSGAATIAPSGRPGAVPPVGAALAVPSSGNSASPVQSAPIPCNPPPCAPARVCAAVCQPAGYLPSPRVADLLSAEQAKKAALGLLAQAGMDLQGTDVKVDVGPAFDAVTIDPVTGGLPTIGMTYSVTLGSKGTIEGASGPLAAPTRLGDYPLAGTSVGFSRLQHQQSLYARGGAMIGMPMPIGGQPLVIQVTGVHLVLVRVEGTDLSGYLEPAYVFETARSGVTAPVPAVVDRLLQSTPGRLPNRPVPVPMPMPAPAPGGQMTPTQAGPATKP